MYYRFIVDMARRSVCETEADTLEEAIQAIHDGSCIWEDEPDEFMAYHRIEIAETLEDLQDGNVEEDEDTQF